MAFLLPRKQVQKQVQECAPLAFLRAADDAPFWAGY